MNIFDKLKKTVNKTRPQINVVQQKIDRNEMLQKSIKEKFNYINSVISENKIEITINKIDNMRGELRRV